MNTLLVVLFVLGFVVLALLPFIHRAVTTRRDGSVPPADGAGTLVEDRPPTDAPTVLEEPPEAPTPVDEQVLDEAPPTVVEPEPVDEPAAPVEAPSPPTLRERVGKARAAISGYLGSVLSRSAVDQATWDEIEEALVLADVGVEATMELVEGVREEAAAGRVDDPAGVLDLLKQRLKGELEADRALRLDDGLNVWLFVGVNGVGKTTTIGKVGRRLTGEGHDVVMAAGDTFRAAAAEQLETWAQRCDAHLVRGSEGADPSSVIFDGIQAAAARDARVVLADTAGRLHTKVNLMEELSKVRRVADRDPGNVTEVLLVVDATTGQNGLQQARQFTESVDVTGVVLTKLDGSAKGGIVFAIQSQLGIPVKLVGLGESAEDLVPFDADEFVDALFEVA